MFLFNTAYLGSVIAVDQFGNAEICDFYDYEVVDMEALYIELLVLELEMVPHLDLSDVMTDDLKDHEVQMDTVYVIGQN